MIDIYKSSRIENFRGLIVGKIKEIPVGANSGAGYEQGVDGLLICKLHVNRTANRRISNVECQRMESLRSIFFKWSEY